MPTINESSTAGFINAMNAAFDTAYAAARDPRVVDCPSVIKAVADAQAAQIKALDATYTAQAATGVFGTVKATIAASKAAHQASAAEVKLRSAIEQALALTQQTER
jgi:hypothetical protein